MQMSAENIWVRDALHLAYFYGKHSQRASHSVLPAPAELCDVLCAPLIFPDALALWP